MEVEGEVRYGFLLLFGVEEGMADSSVRDPVDDDDNDDNDGSNNNWANVKEDSPEELSVAIQVQGAPS